MAATVEVNAKVIDNASPKLNEIDKLVESLNKKSVTIKVDTGSGSGTSGTSRATKEIKEISDVLREAGILAEEAGEKAKSVSTQVGAETKKVTETFKKGIGETVQASSDGTVKITHDYEAQRKAAEKTAAAEKNAAEKAAKAERDSADRRLATWGRIAKVAATAFAIKETKEALSTMKDVDQELANIQKVTDETDTVIKKLGETAYDTASKYGVSATEYLTAAAEFAKAGYTNYSDLSELAIKTRLVGDVSADTAAKFLLSADAAYKFGGNIDSLSTVLDKANVIENNYATSIYKLAEGLPIVASTASMANMSIDELMAGLGTITAVTQETGRKAGTALRALILNIEGEIGTVIDEDMTITQESVESMADALKKYGNEAVKAAQKTGQLVDPMEAIRSLAEAYKKGDLGDQELFDILSKLGGKLRTNQLTALVKNFDMFDEMLSKVEKSAGSADKEIATMLNTWNAKLERLGNTWAKLVSHIFKTDDIKSGIDVLIAALEGLDKAIQTPLGRGALDTAALIVGFTKLSSVLDTLAKSSWGKAIIAQVTETLGSVTGLTGAVEVLKATFSSLNAVSLAALIGELMTVNRIVAARGKINDDRFAHFYTLSTEETAGFGRTTDRLLAESAGNAQAQVAALQTHVEKFRAVYNQLKEELASGADPAEFEKEFGFSVTKFIKDFELAEDTIDSFTPILENASEGSEDLADGFGEIAKAADEATKAIEAFNNATQATKSGNADAYRSAYQQFLEDYKAGKTDTNVVRAAADMFLPESIQEALGYNLRAMGELMASDLYQGIYNGASGNAGVDFVNYMAENMTQALDEIVNITQGADGAYKFEYASAQKLADYFNLPLGAIQALIGALDEFGVQANIGWEEADNLANALGLVGHNADKSGITLEGIARTLKEDFGYSDKTDIAKIISALDAGGYLQGILGEITPEAIGAAISAAFKEAEIDTTPENPPVVEPEIDTTQVDEAKEKIKEIPDEQDKTVNIIVKGLEDINSFKDWLETSPGTYSVKVNDDGSVEVVMGKAGSLDDYLTGMGEGAYSVTVSDDGTISIVKFKGTSLDNMLADMEEGTYFVTVGDDNSITGVMKDAEGLNSFLDTMGDGPYAITVDDNGTITTVRIDAKNANSALLKLENPIEITVKDGQITSAEGKAEDLKKILGNMPDGSEFDLTITGDDAEALATTIGEIEGVHGVKIKEDGSVTAKATTEAFVKVLNQCTDKNVDIKAEVTGTPETKELADEESRIESKDVKVNASVNDGGVPEFANTWNGLKDKTINLTAILKTAGEIADSFLDAGSDLSQYINSGFASAEGTKNAHGGATLVNELGPELISDNGRAYIANGGKPAIVNLGKGAIVLTAEETKQALGHATAYNGINAYAMGSSVELFGSGTVKTGGNSGTGAEGIPGTGTSKWYDYWEDPNKKKSSSSNSDSSKSSSKWEDKEKKLKEELAALEELAEWYHNQKMHDEEGDTYQKAIEKVDALRKEYLKAGFDETAKEVTTLANKIYDYEEDVADAKAHAIEDLEDELDILDSQIELAENQGDLNRMLELQNEAQKKVAKLLEAYRAAGFSDTSPEILKLANMGYDYASDSGSTMKDLWKSLIEALEDMKDTQDDANDLAEKQLAVDEAREALQNAQNQRTVRVFNPVTGQWEWVADSKSIQQAQESLTKAEESLLKEQQSQEFAALKKVMENGGSLSDVTIGPGLSALLSGASLEQTNAFASALGLLSGGLATSADTSAKSIFDSVDSHDNVTQYTFNGVTIDAATAENTTLAELTRMITPLALTTNMPA